MLVPTNKHIVLFSKIRQVHHNTLSGWFLPIKTSKEKNKEKSNKRKCKTQQASKEIIPTKKKNKNRE